MKEWFHGNVNDIYDMMRMYIFAESVTVVIFLVSPFALNISIVQLSCWE